MATIQFVDTCADRPEKRPRTDDSNTSDYSEGKSRQLFEAAQDGDLKGVKRLNREGGSVYYVYPKFHTTPLYIAASKGYLEVVKWLADRDNRLVGKPDRHGRTPLNIAAQNGHLHVVQWLAKKNPKLVTQVDNNNNTPLQALQSIKLIKPLT